MPDAEQELTYMQRYYRDHKEKRRAETRAYYRGHKGVRRAYQRQYYQKHKGECLRYNKAYWEAHKDELREKHRRYYETHREELLAQGRVSGRAYLKTDAGRASNRRTQQRRLSLKAGLPSTLTEAEWEMTLAYFGHGCAYCGVSSESLHQEHVVPVSAGGGYVAANIVPSCRRCNSSKCNMALNQWAKGRGVGFVLPNVVTKVQTYLAGLEPVECP